MTDKYLSQAVLAHIHQLVAAVIGHTDAAEYVCKRYDIKFDDNQLHITDDAFNGIKPTFHASGLLESLEQNLSTELIPALSFILLHVAANDNLGNKEVLSFAYHFADANQTLSQQVLAIFNNTYLQELGLMFDFNTSTIVDKTTKRAPTDHVFAEKMNQRGNQAVSKFKQALIAGKFINENAPITVTKENIEYTEDRQPANRLY